MNKNQWRVLGTMFIFLSFFLINSALSYQKSAGAMIPTMDSAEDAVIYQTFTMKAFLWATLAIVLLPLGLIFITCGFLEGKKKRR